MKFKNYWSRLLHGNICGIIDSLGVVDSCFSPCGELLVHEKIWPMRLSGAAGKWRWNHRQSIHCFCDVLTPEEFIAIQSHLTRKYGLKWWENGHHDIDHILSCVELENVCPHKTK